MKRVAVILSCLLILLTLPLSAQARELPYTDAGAIHNANAVAMLTDLELLEGDRDHAFRPEDTMTRAAVAKLAALIITADPEPAAVAPFYDTERNWAADYINFCYEQGFLDGNGDGSFAPDDPVTARELVKMLLGAIGYDLSTMSGRGWERRLDDLANELNIYNGYELDPGLEISRDYAAQLILNVLNCDAVEGYEDGEPVYLVDDLLNPVTVLESRFGVIRYQEVLTANEYADLDNPDAPLDDGLTKLYGHYPMGFSSGLGDLGRTVTVYLRDGQIVGVPIYNPSEFCVTVQGMETMRTLFDNGGYSLSEDARIYDNCQPADAAALEQLAESDSVTLIDYESDGAIDLALIYRWTVCEALQNSPLVIDTPDGTQVFPGLEAGDAADVYALCIHGKWVVKTF